MGDVDEGGVDTLAQLDDLSPHLVAQLGVQVGQRLIHQKHLGLPHDGTANGHTLALAAGQSLGLALQILGDVQDLCGLLHPAVDLILGHLAQLQGEGHVLIHGHVGIEGVALEHHGDVTVLGLHIVDHAVTDAQLAVGNLLQAGDHPQGGGLTAARGAYQNDKLLIRNLQVEIMNSGHLVVVNLLHILQTQGCHTLYRRWDASATPSSPPRERTPGGITTSLHIAAPSVNGLFSSFCSSQGLRESSRGSRRLRA